MENASIATLWSKLKGLGGRAEQFMPGIFIWWLSLPPWLRPSSNSYSRSTKSFDVDHAVQSSSNYTGLAVLLSIVDRSDQEKHGAARFVPPFWMRGQHFLCWLRFAELRNGETSIKERIHIGGDGTMIFDHLMTQKSGLTRPFLLVMIDRPV